MTNPDNARLLTDERTLLDAEGNLAREEQRLWQRLEALLSTPDDPRRSSLAARLLRVEKLPDAPPAEVARARTLVTDAPAAPVLASGERAGAVQARRVALQSRQLAFEALTAALTRFEAARVAQGRQLDEAEKLLSALEENARRAEAERQAQEAARQAALKAAEEAARQEQAQKTVAELPALDPVITAPGVPTFDAARTMPAVPALDPASSPAVVPAPTAAMRAAPAVSAPPAPATPGAKKRVSRRRRVRLAPPPKKLDVEVATYGEDTFYTGWNRTISDGGLFVVSLETLPLGHELDVEIQLEGQTIKSRGKVQFNRRDNLANPECQSGAGIKLLNLSRDQAATIESFFTQRPPLFFVQP